MQKSKFEIELNWLKLDLLFAWRFHVYKFFKRRDLEFDYDCWDRICGYSAKHKDELISFCIEEFVKDALRRRNEGFEDV